MQHFSLLGPPGAAWRRGWLALLMLCVGTAAVGQTSTIGSTTVPVVSPATSSYLFGPIYRSTATSTFNYSRYAHLYTSAELNIPTGAIITELAWQKSDAAELTGNNVFNVQLANSSLTTLGTTQSWGTLTTGAASVYASTTQQVTGAAGTYFSVTLSAPFVYTGGNLLVLADHEKQGTATAALNFVTNLATGSALGYANGTALTAATNLTAASYGDRRPTLRVTYAPGGPCTAPPTAGTTLASAATVCTGTAVNVSLQGASFGSGQTYQWQESTNGTTFTDISGATSPAYTVASLTATRTFRAQLTCSGQTSASTPVTVTVTAPTYAALPLTESFESAWVDACATRDVPSNNWRTTPNSGNASWRRDDDGTAAGWTNSTTGMYSPAGSQGTRSARFHSYSAGAGGVGTLDLYINLSATGNKVLQFDYLNTAGNDSLQVQVSTDGGATFGSALLRLGLSGTVAQGWQAQNVSVTSTSATTVVRFRGKVTGTFTSDIGMDNVRLAVLTGVPTCATTLLPAAGATNVARNTALTWQAGTGVTTGYDVYFGTTATPPVVSTNQSGTTYAVTALLAPNTTYYYQVVPRNANGPAVGCGVQSFTTNNVPVYCDPSTTNLSGICGANNVTQVTVGGSGLNATGLTCSTVPNGVGTASSAYTSYPVSGSTTGTLLRGLTYPVTIINSGNSILSVWVDFNQDGTFEVTEWAQVATTTTANTAVTANITVPPTAALGLTGMRVRSRGNGNSNGAGDACATFGGGETKDFVVTIGAAPACAPPTALGTANLSTTTATLTFGAGSGTATNYIVQYGPTGFTPGGTGSTTVNTTNLSVPVTGLTANTTYQFYVTKDCGGGQTSQVAGPFTFTTQCLAPVYATLPVTESFENTWVDGCNTRDIPTTSWRNTPATGNPSWRRDDDGTSAGWTVPGSYLYTPNASQGARSARFHSGYSSAGLIGTLDLSVNLSAAGAKRLSFDYVNTSGSDSLVVQLSTDGGSTFTRLAGYGVSGTAATGFVTQVLPLSSTSATAVIRFRARADFGSTDIGLDNIVLESATGCLTPANLTVASTTATSATVSWLGGGSGTYSVLYGPTGFNPAQPSSTTNVYTTVASLTAPPYTITGLTASTAYQFYVVQNCGAGSNSGLAGPVAFNTACVTPTYATLPVTESFENTWISRCATNDVPTNNWRNTPLTGNNSWRRDDDGTSAGWTLPGSYLYTPNASQGARSARFHSGYSSAGLIGTLDLSVNLSAAGAKRLSFDYVNTSGSDSLVVQLSTDGGSTFTRLAGYGVSGTAATGFVTQVLPLSSTSATAVIRFRARADFGSTDIGLDNIVLESATGCLTPANLTVASTTATSATVSWLGGGSGTYSVLYGPTGFNPAQPSSTTNVYTTVASLTAPPYTITGLTASTAYQFYVVQNCGAGSNSGLAGPVAFNTACVTPTYATLPVTESFENTWISRCDTREVPTNNWRNTPQTGNNSWRRNDDGVSAAWVSPNSWAYTPAASQGTFSARFHSGEASNGLIGTFDLFVNLSGASAKRLSFDYINTSGSDSLVVQISNDGGQTFSRLAGYNQSGTVATGFVTQVLPIASTSATAVLRFRGRADYGVTDIGLDNIVFESATGCLTPAVLTSTTTTTTASLSWLTGGTGTYTVVYGPTGFNPATGGTAVSGLTAPPLAITGLTPGTTYQFYVTLNCAGGTNSGTAGPQSFTTQILNDDPCGATTLAVNNACTPLATTTFGATTTASTVYDTGGQGSGCGTLGTPRDVWFKFTTAATGPTSTQVRIAVTGGPASVLRAYSGTACTGPLTFLSCTSSASNTAAPNLDLTGLLPSTTYYVRVSEFSTAGTLGNFTICAQPVPNCPTPAGLAVTNLTSTSTTINWSVPVATGSTFTVIYGPTGFNPQTGGTTLPNITAQSVALTGLASNTAYQVYVQQVCGSFNGSSTLSTVFSFSTPLTATNNDEPCNAVLLGNTVLNGTNVGATTSIQNGINTPACSPAATPKDVWFMMTPSGTTTTLTLTGNPAGMVRVFTTPDCAAGLFTQVFCLASGANNTALSGPVVIPGLTAGQRYYVAVSGYGSSDTPGSFTIVGTSLLASKAQAETNALVVFPNPSNTGQLTLRLSGLNGGGQATLLNALGQVVLTQTLTGTVEQTLTTRNLATGMYTLRVTVAGQVLTRKVVLE